MKKFLFTLVSLFMASSAFANSYFYMEKVEITEDMIGDEITLTVGADFQEYVSAFELWITMPEGLEIVDYEVGSDMKGMKYYNQRGREQSLDASVTTLDMQHFVGITSAAATGYYQPEEGGAWVAYGAVKWEPGVYEEMIILYVEVSAIPTEDVMLRTEPGCGQDPRTDNLATPANGNNIPWGVVPGDTPEPQPAPAPTFREADGKLYAECADHEVVLMLGGEVVENPYTLPAATWEEQVLNFTAYTVANADESENSDPVEYTVTIAAKDDVTAPTPTFREADGKLYAECEGHEVVLMLGEEVVDNPYTLPTNTSYTDPIVLNFSAYTKANGTDDNVNSAAVEYQITIPALEMQDAPTPIITFTPDADGNGVTVEIENYTTYTIKVNDEVVDQRAVPMHIAKGDVAKHIVVWAKNAPQNMNPKEDTKEYDLAAAEPTGTAPGVPEVSQTLTASDVTVSANAEGADEVHIYLWDPTANDGEGDFVRDDDGNPIEIENPTNYTRGDADVTFYVKAKAVNEYGETWTDGYATVVIPAKSPDTAIDELVNGKAVAGVRYFNMAGQEMKEANGVTIVVTTYTDGTTSAVKVIK